MTQVTAKDLKIEIDEMSDRHRALRPDDLFVAWFMKCFVTDTEQEAVVSLVGGSRDKSLDAVYVDDKARKVFVVQGKYRQTTNGVGEKRTDVLAFAELARSLTDDAAYKTYCQGLAPAVAGKAAEARKRIKTHGYGLQLYYVSTGKCSAALVSEATRVVRHASKQADLDVIDGSRVLRLLSDYLDGVAPPVPMLELEIEGGHGVKLSGILQRFDPRTKIESWVVPVAVDQIARMYESAGVRLFARNVRGFLGNTSINQNMQETLDTEPEYFWYYNNGVTIICDSAEQVSRSGNKVLRLVNPQVINGQQTTRTISECDVKNGRATVLVRVISVPRETEAEAERFETLVSQIVAATNWQNAIRASDLMANDRRQIEIERNLRKLDYQYLRKRQSKGEARRTAGVKHRFIITKEELAQVVAACELDPLVVREGKEQLFEERYYGTVFPNSDPSYFLPRYWLGKHVSKGAKGFPERAYAKWLVLHFVWRRLSSALNSKARKQRFREESETNLLPTLAKAVDAAFRGAGAYYRAKRGSGPTQTDPSVFFKRGGHHQELEKFWQSPSNKYKAKFSNAVKDFSYQLDRLMSE